MACELYCCLLPQCEALRICRSGFPIATHNRLTLGKSNKHCTANDCVSAYAKYVGDKPVRKCKKWCSNHDNARLMMWEKAQYIGKSNGQPHRLWRCIRVPKGFTVIRFDMLEVMYNDRKFICIVQICSGLTTCKDQTLLPFWSYPQQCWQFSLITAA